ncbi:MAG TPA: molecular chaperone DnaK, partial [candidate division WWE3 bacterium]|nr:molecular chaperone DnaK [candidate division WWE3 bacterium]
PLTLGIETLGGIATPLIERNTTIPTSASQVFSTAADNQTSVEIHVVQGERKMAIDNKSLGRFVLDGIAPSPRGMPQIEVTFDIDANGILNVSAKDKGTGKEQKIVIQGGTGLNKDEVEKMVQEAEAKKEEDKKKEEMITTRNMADNLCYAAEKSLRDGGDKIPAEIKTEVEEKVKSVRDVLQTATKEELDTKTQELSLAMQKIGEHLYKDQGVPPMDGSAGNDQGNSGDNKGEDKDKRDEPVEGEVVGDNE